MESLQTVDLAASTPGSHIIDSSSYMMKPIHFNFGKKLPRRSFLKAAGASLAVARCDDTRVRQTGFR